MKTKSFKAMSLLLVFAILVGFGNLPWAFSALAAEAEIPEGFIPIYTPEEFNDIRNNLDGNYILMNDLTFQAEDFQEGGAYYNDGIGWMPIGSETTPFTGNLNGNYHMVKGIIIQQSSSMNNDATFYGLFGCVENGTIENLSIIDSLIEVNTATSHIGSLAGGIKNSTIKNCYNTGAINLVSTTTAAVGGIIGYSEKSSINNCKNAGSVIITVKGDSLYSGGIVGYDFGSEITYCCNMGTITEILSPRHIIPAAPIYIAGILGQSFMSNINNCYNNGEIIVKDTVEDMMGYLINAGGISNAGSISYCYNTGNLMIFSRLLSYTGGIAGQAISINNCYNIGQITSNTTDSASSIGGIAGYVSSTLENCYNTGIVAAEASDSYIGGIAGKINESTSVNNNYYLNIIANGIGNGEYMAVSCAIEEMQKSETFVGFNFDSVWTINTCQGYLYPQLQTNRQAPDGHNFSDWQERTPATCTEKGEEYRTCACGEEETREITALGHSFTQYTYNNDATCTENGTETAKCDRCDATDTREVEDSALGHSYSEEWTIDQEPTCTAPGSKSHHCTRCDAKTDVTEIPATGHQFDWVVDTPATEDVPGVQHEECSVCGYKQNEHTEIPQLSHVHTGITHHEAVTATCHQPGTIEYWTCSSDKCAGKYYSDADCTTQITTITTAIDPNNHDGGTEIKNDVEATCNIDGYTGDTYCLGCGALLSKGTVTAATGHTGVVTKEAKAPTCTEEGWTEEIFCSACDVILQPSEPIAALGHHFKDYIADGNATCVEDGTATTTCDRCGTTETHVIVGSALGHDMEERRTEPDFTFAGAVDTVCRHCGALQSHLILPQKKIETALTDVTSEQWFAYAIGYSLDYKLMQGTSYAADGRQIFLPDTPMTRAELVTVLYNMEGQPSVPFEALFDDVSSDQWFAAQVTWASQNELVFGTGNRKFEPDTPISRQDLATILYRYAVDYKGIEMNVENVDALLGAFSDADRVGTYAKAAMAAMNQAGIITGDGDRLKPQENATRAEVATMLSRYLPNVLQSTKTNG